ncbi:MAG TPA: M20 family peptidase [Gemmatimonadales bacterium]|nr:M20 family peptidase [Gemmatimonadales bacterium]
MKRALLAIGVIVVALAAVLVVRTLKVPASSPSPAAAGAGLAFDQAAAAERLAGAIRFATVSYASGGPIDTAAFLGLHQHLQASFPQVHAALTRETVNGLSLLYTWKGADSTLAPVVLMGHMDVVPVAAPNLPEWTHPPFSGDVADGFVWGRGTLDDKTTVLSILEAVEALLREGFRPPRTVYLTFGHDEEVSGRYGAHAIVDLLVSRGVKPALVLDEGGFMATGVIPGLAGRTAIVGIAEKGYLSLKLRARAAGGHSSTPPHRTAIGALSRAIVALEASPFPSSLDGPTLGTLEAMAPYAPFAQRLALANLWLTAPLVKHMMRKSPLGAALLHTTTSPTMLSAGIKDNVLPPEATAVVNFRIRPGETVATVTERVRGIIADSLIVVEPLDSVGVDPSPVSDVHSAAYALITETIRGMTPGEQVPVVPYLVMGGTDAKYWGAHSDRAFRFLAVPLGDGDLERVHGVNERVPVADYATSVNFFARLLRGIGKL